ncbi:MAG: beta-galactosidase [Myxococcales bacterium]|nr:beta-galactosidase [Myxococcales bacterium]
MRSHRLALLLLGPTVAAALACGAGSSGRPSGDPRAWSGRAPAPTSEGDVTVRVLPDGSFDPPSVTIHEGATVTWELSDRYRQSIAPLAKGGATCADIAPYEGWYADLTGPMPRNPSGLFILNQDGPGLRQTASGELVSDGPLGAVTDATWASDENVGAFLRLRWNWIQPEAEGRYDWTILDREVEKAVANGKLYSVGVKAGFHGTPAWIFDAGVDRLVFRDYGTHPGSGDCKCGAFMALGNPTQRRYQELYDEMLDELARHLASNAAWYRSLAYVKPSGANLYTVEARLPKRCDCAGVCTERCAVPKDWKDAPNVDASGRICNTRVWAEAGYTPEGLYAFYERQLEHLARNFPEKDFAYLLIHDGFPRVQGRDDYLGCGERKKRSGDLPDPVEQTREILRRGWRTHGERFTIMHAALKAGKPINRLLRTERQPTQFIAEQASNDAHQRSQLRAVVQQGLDDGANFIELYEEPTLQGGASLASYNAELHQRRERAATGDGPRRDPFPATHSYRFGQQGTVNVVNPATCGQPTPAVATVTVIP